MLWSCSILNTNKRGEVDAPGKSRLAPLIELTYNVGDYDENDTWK